MAKIIGELPRMVCPSCKCTFEYTASDVKTNSEQYWAGFWKAWQWKSYRTLKCPGCSKNIRL